MSTLGVLLLVVGAALVVAEAHVISHGVLGGLATLALAAGIALVAAGAGAGLVAGLAVGLAAGSLGGVYVAFVAGKAVLARRAPARAGLVGHIGRVRAQDRVLVDGELWRARGWDSRQLQPGDPVVVDRIDGLTLTVRPAEEWEVLP